MRTLRDLWLFLAERKKLWLLPLVLILLCSGALVLLAEGGLVLPFLYPLFG